jgi:hypothetical protein
MRRFAIEQTLESSAARLLADVTDIIKRYEAERQKTGEKYNLFRIMRTGMDEVKICRVLAELLNPEGSHGRGDLYLKRFVERIGAINSVYEKIGDETAWVDAEYPTNTGRRIDIVIGNGKIFAPVEVKIRAGDQPAQVADYFAFAKTKNECHVPVIYLTVDGCQPNDPGVVEGTHYERLSFDYDILPWLNECLEETPKESRVLDNIAQLIEAVALFCGIAEDTKMNDEILELITKSPDTVKAAEAIRSVSDFDNRALDVFRGPVLTLVKKTFPKAKYKTENLGDVIWKYIEIPIRDGKYLFQVNYDWRAIWVHAGNGKDGKSQEGAALNKKMGELFKAEAWSNDGSAWASEDTSWPSLASCIDDRTLYLARLSKLSPQEAAEKILAIACALESVKAQE